METLAFFKALALVDRCLAALKVEWRLRTLRRTRQNLAVHSRVLYLAASTTTRILSFRSTIFETEKSQESKEFRKKWIHLTSRKDISLTTGHSVCSEYFPGGKKNYKNCLPTIVTKTIKPTPTNPRPTTKARNRTVPNPSEVPAQQGRCRLFSEVEQDTFDVQNIEPEETLQSGTDENTNLSILLREQTAELTKENKRLKSENERQRTQINKLKEKLKIKWIKWIKSRNILLVNFTILTRKKTKIQIFVGKSQEQNKSFKKRLRHFRLVRRLKLLFRKLHQT